MIESTRNLRHLEWGGIPAQGKDEKLIVARILAAMRDLRWCDVHWDTAMTSARALASTVLNPRVRDGMVQIGKSSREALDSVRVITHEGKYIRDLLEQIVDMKADIHPAVKHLRGLCSNILKVGGGWEPGAMPSSSSSSSSSSDMGPRVVVDIDFPATLRHTGLSDHVIKTPRTVNDIDIWPWTNLCTLDWSRLSIADRRRATGAWRDAEWRCLEHPDAVPHFCWSTKALKEISPPEMKEPPKGKLLERWNEALYEVYEQIRRYETRMYALHTQLLSGDLAPEEFDIVSLWSHKETFPRTYRVLGLKKDRAAPSEEKIPEELSTGSGMLLKEMLLRDCIEGQFPPEGAMELVRGEDTKIVILGPKGGVASMGYTLNVIAAKRYALLRKMLSSVRNPETGALRLDIQAINEQLLEIFKMRGIFTRHSPITLRMMEAFWRAEERNTAWTTEYVNLALLDAERSVEERLGTTPPVAPDQVEVREEEAKESSLQKLRKWAVEEMEKEEGGGEDVPMEDEGREGGGGRAAAAAAAEEEEELGVTTDDDLANRVASGLDIRG